MNHADDMPRMTENEQPRGKNEEHNSDYDEHNASNSVGRDNT
jgi:hypothetical protein